jgi:hypothetical protein
MLDPLPLFAPTLTSILQACTFAELSKVAKAAFLSLCSAVRGLLPRPLWRSAPVRPRGSPADQVQGVGKVEEFNSKLDTHLARARRARHSGSACAV